MPQVYEWLLWRSSLRRVSCSSSRCRRCSSASRSDATGCALLLAARAEQRAEKALWPLNGRILRELEPIHILIHVRPERADVAYLDALLCGEPHGFAILD